MSESNATIVGAVVGAIIGICGSLATFLVSHRTEQRELRDCSMKDLIAELEQNKTYQTTSAHIDLEHSAYERLRERGFFYTFPTELHGKLQELYASIHEKNGLIAYYNSVGVPGSSATAEELTDISDVIEGKGKRIALLIDEILPKLRILLKRRSP
jgi:gas vesicle protein